jgi:hypothetical protein
VSAVFLVSFKILVPVLFSISSSVLFSILDSLIKLLVSSAQDVKRVKRGKYIQVNRDKISISSTFQLMKNLRFCRF